MNLLPKTEAVARVQNLQMRMQEAGTDAVFILQNADLYYFSGTVQTGVFCVPSTGEPLYLVQKSLERARAESPWNTLLRLASLKKVPEILAAERWPRLECIGMELDVVPASYYLRFRELFPHAEFTDASEPVRLIRMLKSPYEAEQIRRAAGMLTRTFAEFPNWIRAGVTELEVMARVEDFLRGQGHQGITRVRSFNGEMTYGPVASGPVASYPTRFPGCTGFLGLYPAIPNSGSRRVLGRGESIMADLTGGYAGYVSDQTRTFSLGELPEDFVAAHEFILSLMRGIESMLKPGMACSEVYRFALEVVRESPYLDNFMGWGDNQVRFIGHGVGLELDELPVLAPGYETPLQPGMTIAIEPKIFFAERGGVGIENNYLITDTGYEKLSPAPEEIRFP